MYDKEKVTKDLEQVGNALTAAHQIRNLISETDHGGFLAQVFTTVLKEIDRLTHYEEAVRGNIKTKFKQL